MKKRRGWIELPEQHAAWIHRRIEPLVYDFGRFGADEWRLTTLAAWAYAQGINDMLQVLEQKPMAMVPFLGKEP